MNQYRDEEAKSSNHYFPQELIMRLQVDRQEQPLKDQQELYNNWRKQESFLIGKLVLATTFTETHTEYPDWEFASFYPGGTGLDPAAEIRGTWKPAVLHATAQGLQIRSIILRTASSITLRSLACEVKLSFRLVEDATLWVVTRGSGVRDPDSAICKIKKEKDSQRVFIIFGGAVGPSHEFKFFKRQEIPEINDESEDAISQDYVDIKMTYIDNGDDKIFIRMIGNSHSASNTRRRMTHMTCNKFIPTLTDSHLMIAGSGDSVFFKNVSVKHVERCIGTIVRNTTHHECCDII